MITCRTERILSESVPHVFLVDVSEKNTPMLHTKCSQCPSPMLPKPKNLPKRPRCSPVVLRCSEKTRKKTWDVTRPRQMFHVLKDFELLEIAALEVARGDAQKLQATWGGGHRRRGPNPVEPCGRNKLTDAKDEKHLLNLRQTRQTKQDR